MSSLKRVGVRAIAVAALLVSALLVNIDSAQAIAPGCTSARPTSLGGLIYAHTGDYNRYLVPAQVSLDLKNSSNQKVDINGNVAGSPNYQGAGGYSYIDKVNPYLRMPGVPGGTPLFDTHWGEDGTNGPICVSSSVTRVFVETYPKQRPGNTTDKTYYGGSMDHNMTVTPGAKNEFVVRLPTRAEYSGNTGDVNGYITKNGNAVDPSRIDRIRAWSTDGGTACGTQGFAAAADVLGVSQTFDATYYRIEALAGGQCHGSYQEYDLYVQVDGVTQVKRVKIRKGTRPRVDFSF